MCYLDKNYIISKDNIQNIKFKNYNNMYCPHVLNVLKQEKNI